MTALVPVTGPPSPDEWQSMLEQADVIARSGLAPDTASTPEKVAVIALKGRELGVPPMQALSHINVIKGKPTLSAEMMRALVARAGHRLRIVETSDARCVLDGIRSDDPEHVTTVEWTLDRARRANLRGGSWSAYPAAMLLARATSELCRAVFPDVLMGASYTPEELGADVGVSDDGMVEVTDVTRLEPDAPDEAVDEGDVFDPDAAYLLRNRVVKLGADAVHDFGQFVADTFDGRRLDALSPDELEVATAKVETMEADAW